MEALDRDTAEKLYKQYRKQRDGIRNQPEMASICLICASVNVITKADDIQMRVCRNCNFSFYRYDCSACGATIDGRDPLNPGCAICGLRICTCGACGCPPDQSLRGT
ncbi:MAG: hypothetical protein EHM79_16510 [Geobacter sp.]|nr:MAG: hypothetical protein EHM79_16510 [Geobacter sp.]